MDLGMAQEVEHLLSKCKVLRFKLQPYQPLHEKKSSGVSGRPEFKPKYCQKQNKRLLRSELKTQKSPRGG
jgi:hypothetical protein